MNILKYKSQPSKKSSDLKKNPHRHEYNNFLNNTTWNIQCVIMLQKKLHKQQF